MASGTQEKMPRLLVPQTPASPPVRKWRFSLRRKPPGLGETVAGVFLGR